MRFLRGFSIRLSNFTAGRRTDHDLHGFGESQPFIDLALHAAAGNR